MLFYDGLMPVTGFNAAPKRFEASIAVPGVFTYYVHGKPVRHYRPLAEIFADRTVESLKDALVTIDHPTDDTNPAHGVGAVIDSQRDPKGTLSGSLLLLNEQALELAKAGSQISPKFEADVYPESGIWHDDAGKPHAYDAVQRNIVYRSVGLVGSNGRQGDRTKIYRQLSADSNSAIAEVLGGTPTPMNLNQESVIESLQRMITTLQNGQMTIPSVVADSAPSGQVVANVTQPVPVVQPQAPVGQPQAPVVQPQVPVGQPQAQVGQPQAQVVQPQAQVVQPQAQVVQPQAQGVQREVQPSIASMQGGADLQPIQVDPNSQAATAPPDMPVASQQPPTGDVADVHPVADPDKLGAALAVAQLAVSEGIEDATKLQTLLYQALLDPGQIKQQILAKHGITLTSKQGVNDFFEGFMAAKQQYAKGKKGKQSAPVGQSVAQPQVQVVQPQAQVAQPQVQVVQPQAQVVQPQAQVMQPQAQVMQPQAQVMQPQAQVTQPLDLLRTQPVYTFDDIN